MNDRQFSVPAPWPETLGEETRVMVDSFIGGEYFINVSDKVGRFEWSERFGPLPLNKHGAEAVGIGPRHSFWRAVSLWKLQGCRLDGNNAIWHEPKKDVLERRGHMLFVVEHGEPGQDW